MVVGDEEVHVNFFILIFQSEKSSKWLTFSSNMKNTLSISKIVNIKSKNIGLDKD